MHNVRLALSAPRRHVAAAIAINIMAGVLPVILAIAIARAVTVLRSDSNGDTSAWATATLLVTLIALASKLSEPLSQYVSFLLAERIDVAQQEKILSFSAHAPYALVAEDGTVRRDVSDAREALWGEENTPGGAAASLLTVLTRYSQAMGGAIIAGIATHWWVGAIAFASGLLLRVPNRVSLDVFARVWDANGFLRQRRMYYRRLMMDTGPALEFRVLGVLDRLLSRHKSASMSSMLPVWRARRRIFLGPWLALVPLAAALSAGAMLLAGRTVSDVVLGASGILLAAQGLLAAQRIGSFFEESDVQTQFGMRAYHLVSSLDARLASQRTDSLSETTPGPRKPPTIEFRDVSFSYGEGRAMVLQHANFVVPAGETFAIVGENGAGKSTLVKIALGLLAPTEGSILVDGHPLTSIDVPSWHHGIACAFQDFVRYPLSVRENVSPPGASVVSDEAIEHALERAGALDLVRGLPRGLDTPLTSAHMGGVDLSGGEWQRLALARAILKLDGGAHTIVLDEPTSSLDARAEQRFVTELSKFARGTTALVISHRFATVKRASTIMVMDRGQVKEIGDHDALMARRGIYSTMYDAQTSILFGEGTEG